MHETNFLKTFYADLTTFRELEAYEERKKRAAGINAQLRCLRGVAFDSVIAYFKKCKWYILLYSNALNRLQ
eukprot:scaffold65320_cov34-Prasinocladus_malaysianus.AAC.1